MALMKFSKEALDLLKACEAFIALVQNNGATKNDRDMALYYLESLHGALEPREFKPDLRNRLAA
jgi:hypothetical protein